MAARFAARWAAKELGRRRRPSPASSRFAYSTASWPISCSRIAAPSIGGAVSAGSGSKVIGPPVTFHFPASSETKAIAVTSAPSGVGRRSVAVSP